MSAERVSVGEEGESDSTQSPDTEKVPKTTEEIVVRGVWRLRVSVAERRVREES